MRKLVILLVALLFTSVTAALDEDSYISQKSENKKPVRKAIVYEGRVDPLSAPKWVIAYSFFHDILKMELTLCS